MREEDKTEKRVARHQITQEDFTPTEIVDAMLDKVPVETFTDFTKTIFDTSCGIGNFLVECLRRRLQNTKTQEQAVEALSTIYGVELMADNVKECRDRLYSAIKSYYPTIANDFFLNYKVRAIIRNRIQWHDSLTFDYEHWPTTSYRPRPKHERITFEEVKRAENTKYPMWEEI